MFASSCKPEAICSSLAIATASSQSANWRYEATVEPLPQSTPLSIDVAYRPLTGNTFEVVVDRSTGTPLGVDVREGSALLITNVHGGLVGDWNKNNPHSMIMAGDWIIQVNGHTQDLCTECGKLQILCLELLRTTVPVGELSEFEDAQRRAEGWQIPMEDLPLSEHGQEEPSPVDFSQEEGVISWNDNDPEEDIPDETEARPWSGMFDLKWLPWACVSHAKQATPEIQIEEFERQKSPIPEPQPSGPKNNELNKQWRLLEDILMADTVKLVKGSYLVSLHEAGECCRPFHDLPAQAFWEPLQALRLAAEAVMGDGDASRTSGQIGLSDEPTFIHALSYRWLSVEHPDPEGFHLALIAHIARLVMKRRMELGHLADVAIFWDFVSVAQEPGSADDSMQRAHSIRSAAALFAHSWCCVWAQPQMPTPILNAPQGDSTGGSTDMKSQEGSDPKSEGDSTGEICTVVESGNWTFEESGWCQFELALTDLGRTGHRCLDMVLGSTPKGGLFRSSSVVATCWSELSSICSVVRQPPLQPTRFEAKIAQKVFLHPSDVALAASLYSEAFELASTCKDAAYFGFASWGPPEMKLLKEVLPQFRGLGRLILDGNPLGDEGAETLSDTLASMIWLRELHLVFCGISAQGATAIALALALAQYCEVVDFSFNTLEDEGAEALATTLVKMPMLRELRLQGCGIGDRGAGATAALMAQAPALSTLLLSQNCLSSAACTRIEQLWASNSAGSSVNVRRLQL